MTTHTTAHTRQHAPHNFTYTNRVRPHTRRRGGEKIKKKKEKKINKQQDRQKEEKNSCFLRHVIRAHQFNHLKIVGLAHTFPLIILSLGKNSVISFFGDKYVYIVPISARSSKQQCTCGHMVVEFCFATLTYLPSPPPETFGPNTPPTILSIFLAFDRQSS